MSQAGSIPTDALTPDSPPPVALKLVVVSGEDAGKELVLEAGSYRVGKDPACELVLTDGAVSRTHLLVEVISGGARLTDQGSKNGSFYQGARFDAVVAQAPARIRVGHTELELLPRATLQSGPPPSQADRFGGLIGKSLEMRRVFALLERLAKTDTDVLLRGETGSGKEVCARSLHEASGRAKGPLVVCDLAAVAPTLAASQLFGHARGAFTGAVKDQPGLAERAHGGTLFLDELGEFPLELQPNLLRLLERREVRRVGETQYRRIDLRVIAATHRDLQAEVKAGRFRDDLYHRVAVVTVTLPALRDRREDIAPLIDALLERMGKPPSALSPETRALLLAHPWPGNVRELRNMVERVVALGGPAEPEAPASTFREAKERLVAAFEKDYLRDLMKRCGNNVSQAAREAGMDRVNLHRLLKKHGADR